MLVGLFVSRNGKAPDNDNAGNWKNLANPMIPSNIKNYIARQFKYVLFDQGSFAVHTNSGGPIVSMMPTIYHTEAESLMNRNPNLIVFPYFSFTVARNEFPWMQNIDTTWILHGNREAENLLAGPELS